MFLLVSALVGLVPLYYVLLCIYRLTLHPLAKYPGPWQNAVSNWPQVLQMSRGHGAFYVHQLHEQYGDVVRTAPDCLTFRSINAVHDIYDRKANVIKAGWTDVSLAVNPTINTHALNDRQVHAKRRRLLANAFSESALRSLEHFIIDRIQAFCNIMAEPKSASDKVSSEKDDWSKPRDISVWSNNLTLDVLGELCFGKSFEALETGTHMAAELLITSSKINQFLAFLPGRHLLFPLLRNQALMEKTKSKLIQQKLAFRAMMLPLLKARFAKEAETKETGASPRHDFMHYLIKAQDPQTGEKFAPPDLVGEAALLVGAGSDTTSTCISATCFYLVRHPEALRKLQDEIRSAFDSVDEIKSGPKISSLPYLRACIDEGLRISPPVPGVLHRRVLPGGYTVDGHHLPADTIVGASAHAVHHSEAHFTQPYSYIPERWIPDSPGLSFPVTESSIEFQKQAFIPFSLGPRNCVGKNMAMMELLVTFARMMWLFDIRSVAGEDGKKGEAKEAGGRRKGEYDINDWFVAEREGPVVEFRKREDVAA